MNKRKKGLTLMILGGLGLLLGFGLSLKGNVIEAYGAVKKDDVVLETNLPIKGDMTLPFKVLGKAKGTMFFEGSFPAIIEDVSGAILFSSIAKAKGEWMTEDFVPFEIDFTDEGKDLKSNLDTPLTLHLKKDNPSGIEELDGGVKILFVK